MQILLIRHGESEDDFLEENYNGSTDLPLTPNGLIQVEKMSQRVLNEFPPDFKLGKLRRFYQIQLVVQLNT